jgi:MFS superfamily sulfate permease-like transporter
MRGNQEMIGIGAANVVAGFQGFPVSTSGSRIAVAEQASSKSQLTGLVGAAGITLVLVFAAGAMQNVQQPTLSAIVIASALSLADIAGTRRLWRHAPLIFANARTFADSVRAIAEQRPELRWLVMAAGPITDVDTTASDMLQELDAWLNERGASLILAEMKDPVREKIERYELTRTIDPAHFFRTLDEAVAEYVRQTGVAWRGPGRAP